MKHCIIIITVSLISSIIRLLHVAFSPNRKVLKSRINLPYEKTDHNSISSVNKYLNDLEKSIPVYKVKAAGAELLDREFNAGKDEERLEKAKKYFKIVHQNFLYKQVNEERFSGPTLNTLELYLYRVTIKDGEKEEVLVKKLKENKINL
jgi:hypothetical protein